MKNRHLAIMMTYLVMFVGATNTYAVFTGSASFGPNAYGDSIAWGDYDNDGDLDLVICGSNNRQLFINNGDTTFTEDTAFASTDDAGIFVWGDCDNDGYLDLAVGIEGQNQLYMNNGDGSFTVSDEFVFGHTCGMAWGDFDNDADLDLAVGNGWVSPEQDFLYINDGMGNFTQTFQFNGFGTSCIAAGDYDNDGDLDLAVGREDSQQNLLYINNGDETFTEQTQFFVNRTRRLLWGDHDYDGDLDMAVMNWYNEQNYLYKNVSGGIFTHNDEFGIGIGKYTTDGAWADFDNDGDLDFIEAVDDDYNRLYENDGSGNYPSYSNESSSTGATYAIAWADYDNDGDMDFAEGTGWQPNVLYTNDQNDSGDDDYLTLNLVGDAVKTNRDAIGAFVYIYEEGWLGVPTYLLGCSAVEANGGLGGQNSIDAEFGVLVDYVDILVKWSTFEGYEAEAWTNIAKGQALTLEQGFGWSGGVYNGQDDWSGGGGVQGPATEWTDEFFEETGIDYSVPGKLMLDQTKDYETTGNLTSSVLDLGDSANPHWVSIDWNAITPLKATTAVTIQLRTGNSWGAMGAWSDEITKPGSLDGYIEDGYRYVQYKVNLSTSDPAQTPHFFDLTLYYEETIDIGDDDDSAVLPTSFQLRQSYPNPTNNRANIAFVLPREADITLELFDIKGRKISVLVEGKYDAGYHSVNVDNLANGIYLYRLKTDGFEAVKKMIVK